MKIRKFNSKEDFKVIEDVQCCWCEAGHTLVNWGGEGGTIFLENDQGEIRMIDGEPLMDNGILITCTPTTANEARDIIGRLASS